MWICKLCYILFLLGLTVFFVLYIDSLALVILLASLMLPVFLKLGLVWFRRQSRAFLSCSADHGTVGKSVPVSLMIENTCPLSFPKAIATIRVQHVFSRKSEQIRLKFPVHGRNTTKLTFWVNPECCGAVKISLEKIRVLDAFCLFHTDLIRKSKKQNPGNQLELLILPESWRMPLTDQSEAVYAPESNQYSDRPGDDPSEIFDIRAYHPGDAVSRIHWKLSSRFWDHSKNSGNSEMNLFVKEFSDPVEKRILLIAEYLPGTVEDRDDLRNMQQAQAMLTLIYSTACGFAEYARRNLESRVSLVWYDGASDEFVSRELTDPEDLKGIFRELYRTLDSMTLKSQILREALTGQTFSSVTMLTNDTGEESLRILEQQVTANRKNLLILDDLDHLEHENSGNPGNTPGIRSDQVAVQMIPPETFRGDDRQLPGIVI